MENQFSDSTWRELDEMFREYASQWAANISEACHVYGEDDFARFDDLSRAAAISSTSFASQWKTSIGDVTKFSDLAEELKEQSSTFRKPERLIEQALRATKSEIRHHKASLRLANNYYDYENRIDSFFPDVRLVIDHAVYALYVAWRPDSKIIIPDNRPKLLRAMAVDESFFRVVTPRQFEELVAYLYECMGCTVELTPATRDFGADLLAWHAGPLSSETLIAVQVKRYASHRKVGLKGLFELHGAVSHYQADTGHIVTTSDFTKPAKLFGEQQRLHLVNMKQFQKELNRLF